MTRLIRWGFMLCTVASGVRCYAQEAVRPKHTVYGHLNPMLLGLLVNFEGKLSEADAHYTSITFGAGTMLLGPAFQTGLNYNLGRRDRYLELSLTASAVSFFSFSSYLGGGSDFVAVLEPSIGVKRFRKGRTFARLYFGAALVRDPGFGWEGWPNFGLGLGHAFAGKKR